MCELFQRKIHYIILIEMNKIREEIGNHIQNDIRFAAKTRSQKLDIVVEYITKPKEDQ